MVRHPAIKRLWWAALVLPWLMASAAAEPQSQEGLPPALIVHKPKDLRDEVRRLEHLAELGRDSQTKLGWFARQKKRLAGEKLPRQVWLPAIKEQPHFFEGQIVVTEGVLSPVKGEKGTFWIDGKQGAQGRLESGAETIGFEADKGIPADFAAEIVAVVDVERVPQEDGSELSRPVLYASKITPSAALNELRIARQYDRAGKWERAVQAYQHFAGRYRNNPYAVFALVRAAFIARDELGNEKMAAKALSRAWDQDSNAQARRTFVGPLYVFDADQGQWVKQDLRSAIGPTLDEINRENKLYQVMDWFARVCGGDPALGVILMAIITRALTFPLNLKQMKSAKAMQALQPQMKEIQERYKEDKGKAQQAMFKMFREHGVNPLGGCWPMLIQLPILIALYRGIRMYIVRFDGTSFLWMDNLANPNILLLGVYTVSQIGFQALTQKLQPPATDAQQAQSQKMMMWMMPLLFFMFFQTFPAAFILYWLATNMIYIVLQYAWMRQEGVSPGDTGPPADTGARIPGDGGAKKKSLIETIIPGFGSSPGNPGKSRASQDSSNGDRKTLAERQREEARRRRGRPRRKRRS